jgi:hypothetical protein
VIASRQADTYDASGQVAEAQRQSEGQLTWPVPANATSDNSVSSTTVKNLIAFPCTRSIPAQARYETTVTFAAYRFL